MTALQALDKHCLFLCERWKRHYGISWSLVTKVTVVGLRKGSCALFGSGVVARVCFDCSLHTLISVTFSGKKRLKQRPLLAVLFSQDWSTISLPSYVEKERPFSCLKCAPSQSMFSQATCHPSRFWPKAPSGLVSVCGELLALTGVEVGHHAPLVTESIGRRGALLSSRSVLCGADWWHPDITESASPAQQGRVVDATQCCVFSEQ